MSNFLSVVYEKLDFGDINVFLVNLISAVILLAIGIFLGNFVKFILKKGVEKSNLDRTTKSSFVELFLTIIKWSIYILFISLALQELGIPQLTSWLTSVLVVIPALVGALILIAVGFAIAVYLRDLTNESEILSHKILSIIFFYFVLYVFLIFAIKTALITMNKETVNILLMILTAVVSVAVAYWHVKIRK